MKLTTNTSVYLIIIIFFILIYSLTRFSQKAIWYYRVRSTCYNFFNSIYTSLAYKKDYTDIIICFGDSFTEGEGVGKNDCFPSLINNSLSIACINKGIGGNTTLDGLKRLRKDVLNLYPKFVIIQFGGNDFKRGYGRIDVELNLYRITKTIINILPGSHVILLVSFDTEFIENLLSDRIEQKSIRFINIQSIMKGRIDPYTKHPDREAHKIVAEMCVEVIDELLMFIKH
jgi:hypothetical protein